MAAGFDIAGRLTVAVEGLDGRDLDAVAAQFDPYAAGPPPAAPDVVLAVSPALGAPLTDIQRNAGDGRVTATDGARFYVLAGGTRCAVPPPGGAPPARFELEPGFPVGHAVRRLVRPALQVALPARGAVAVHAAAVAIDGRAVLVGGWSESGKTETALALLERGATFVSDKWTVVGEDGTAAAFPITVGVRGGTLAYLPRLRAGLGRAPRARLAAAGAARAARRVLPHDGVHRVLMAADRVALAPSAVRAAYGDDGGPWQVPLGAVAVLTTVPGGQRPRGRPTRRGRRSAWRGRPTSSAAACSSSTTARAGRFPTASGACASGCSPGSASSSRRSSRASRSSRCARRSRPIRGRSQTRSPRGSERVPRGRRPALRPPAARTAHPVQGAGPRRVGGRHMSRRRGGRARRMRKRVYLPMRPLARTKIWTSAPARNRRRIVGNCVARWVATAVRSFFGQPRPAHFTRMRAPAGARTSRSEMSVERPTTRPAIRTIGNGSRSCAGRAARAAGGAAAAPPRAGRRGGAGAARTVMLRNAMSVRPAVSVARSATV